LVNADEWCTTAGTDGRNFYYNSRFIDKLRPKEIEFLFGHEVLHCVYDHFGRRGDRDAQLYNCAADYCVNSDLIKHRVGEKITTVPCLYDSKYDGKSSEEIYDILYENAEKIDVQKLIEQLLDDHMDGDESGEGGGDGEDDNGRPKLSQAEKDAIKDEIKQAMIQSAAAAGAARGLLVLGSSTSFGRRGDADLGAAAVTGGVWLREPTLP
jgi:predicted metal-dependent peptidase